MKSPRHQHRPFALGFTVLEVLVAVTIFAIISTIIFSVFRVAIRSQVSGDREMMLLQQARFAFDSIERDLSTIYFRDETSYNVQIAKIIEDMEAARIKAERENSWDQFYALYGNPEEDKEDQNPAIGDPYEKGRIIDLQFQGKNSGMLDALLFATYSPLRVGGAYRPWGLQRVDYSVNQGILVRVADTVEAETRNQVGEVVILRPPPEVSRLAEGVLAFDVGYCFWFDNQWYETESWNSTNRQIRNPRYMMGSYDVGNQTTTQQNENADFGPGQPGYNESLNDSPAEPLDRLPAYIRVRLEIGEKGMKQGEGRVFQRLFRVCSALETWIPAPEIDEEIREAEQVIRDETYRIVAPGTTVGG